MTRYLVAAFAAFALLTASVHAQKVEQGTMKRTSVTDAKGMFENYCATCHGRTGVGDGPAAKALAKAPADLTKLSERNKGTFPEVRVKRYIEGLDEVAAHGTRDMPMWGPLFRSLERDTAVLRVQALSDYLKAMQK